MKDEIIRKQEELIEYSVSILRGLYPLLMIDSSKCIEKILIRLESNLAELKEQEETCDCTHTQACKICAKSKDIDWSIIEGREQQPEQEERPKIEDYFEHGVTMSEVHKEYTGSPALFKYAQALDSYIDEWINKWKGE